MHLQKIVQTWYYTVILPEPNLYPQYGIAVEGVHHVRGIQMSKSRPYEEIDDEAADRILSTIDIKGDWYDIRKRLVKRYSKWSAYQRDRMAARIIDRRIEREEFEAGIPDKPVAYIKMSIDKATGPGGTSKARYKMVRDITGKYLGRPGNIRVTTRKGNKVYAKNILTGKKGRIK